MSAFRGRERRRFRCHRTLLLEFEQARCCESGLAPHLIRHLHNASKFSLDYVHRQP